MFSFFPFFLFLLPLTGKTVAKFNLRDNDVRNDINDDDDGEDLCRRR